MCTKVVVELQMCTKKNFKNFVCVDSIVSIILLLFVVQSYFLTLRFMCDLYSRNSMGNFIIAEVLPQQLFVEGRPHGGTNRGMKNIRILHSCWGNLSVGGLQM